MLKNLAAAKNVLIGTEVRFWGNEPQVYKDKIIQEFNLTSFFNYFNHIHPKREVYDFREPDRELAFALQNNKKLLASGLIFWWADPDWVKVLARKYLKPVLVNHIKRVMNKYKGKVPWWVVVNENIGHPNPQFVRWAKIGSDPFDYVRIAYRTARATDPAARLLYNDTGFELGGARADRIFKILKRLRNESVPIDGIGFQCHFKTEVANNLSNALAKFEASINRFRSIGLEPYITELDVAIPRSIGPTAQQLQKQKDIYKAFLSKALEKGVDVLMLWGFTDQINWLQDHPTLGFAHILDTNYQKKPAYFGVEEALS